MKKIVIKKVRKTALGKTELFSEELKRLMRWRVKLPMQVFSQ